MVHISDSGVCPCCGSKLALNILSAKGREEFRQKLLTLAKTASPDGRSEAQDFVSFLQDQPKFTVAIDAANVGHNSQNFWGGGFSVEQIDMVAQAVKQAGGRPLIVLPKMYTRHLVPYNSKSQKERSASRESNEFENRIKRRWKYEGILFTPTDSGMDDDWYWLYFTVAYDDLDNPVYVITNDEARDHGARHLSKRDFYRWREGCIIRYQFGTPLVNPSRPKHRILRPPCLTVTAPRAYTREFQHSKSDRTLTWHIPIVESLEQGQDVDSGAPWLCMHLVTKS